MLEGCHHGVYVNKEPLNNSYYHIVASGKSMNVGADSPSAE